MVALVEWGAKSRAVPVSGFARTSCISDGLGHIFQTLIVNDDIYLKFLEELNNEC